MAMLGLFNPTGDATATPTSVDYRRKMAMQLAQQATDSSPKGHWAHILAQALQGGVSGYEQSKAKADETAGRATVGAAFADGATPSVGAIASNPWMPASVLPHVLGAGDRAADRSLRERQLALTEAQTRASMADAAERRPLTMEALRLDLDKARRDAVAPPIESTTLAPGAVRIITDKRTGAEVSRIGGPPPKLEPATIKEMHEADDIIRTGVPALATYDKMIELSDKATAGPLAGWRSYIGSLGSAAEADAARKLENMATRNALTQLKAIFGGNPTEGERAILLKVEGALSETKENRRAIFSEARDALHARVRAADDKRRALASGGYYKPDYDPAAVFRAPTPPAESPPAPGLPSPGRLAAPGLSGAPVAPRVIRNAAGEEMVLSPDGRSWVKK